MSRSTFNPAAGTGLTLVSFFWESGSFGHLWLYWAGPLAGGALAAVVFMIQASGSHRKGLIPFS
jgi:glycerol uptake facilitator-like aquaporin